MSLINGLVDRHPVNVVHMCTVHRGAEESTPALQRHCGGSFLRVGEQERGGGGEGGGRKGNESRERRMKLLEALGSAVVKGSEWERRPCSQPHGPFSLGIMEAFSVVLNPLVACWERAAVRPPLTTDTLRHAHPLDNWILHPEKSPPFLGRGSPLHVALTGNSPRISPRGRSQSQDLCEGFCPSLTVREREATEPFAKLHSRFVFYLQIDSNLAEWMFPPWKVANVTSVL